VRAHDLARRDPVAGEHKAEGKADSKEHGMTGKTDTVIIGAGPYGLSIAAHLSAAGVAYRHFGVPMRLWRSAMPHGMYLKSQGFASDLSDPAGAATLEAFCAQSGRPYRSYGLPVSLETFTAYCDWFTSKLGLAVEETLVTGVERAAGGFTVATAAGEMVTARAVVVAIGVEHFAYVPPVLAALPPELCTHSSAHGDLGVYKGQNVVVVGAGQSALESAALLHEADAKVTLLARRRQIAWNGQPLDPKRPLLARLREPEAGLGSGWNTWFYSDHPDLFRRLPTGTRVTRARTALGPAGACWLRPRVEGQFPLHTGVTVTAARPETGVVRLTVISGDGGSEITAEHVIAATGYRPDLGKLGFLGQGISATLRTVGGTPLVGRGYESSVPGLYFTGPLVAPSYGPVMRFVFGTRHAAPALSRHLIARAGRPVPAAAGVR
jgi:FAD-dependent urate hydroxylase